MKNSYILLRNNTESIPLFLEDLQQIGLKPDDLIWIECQSVSWRYPHEIAELRSLLSANYVPVVTISTNPPIIDAKPFDKKIPEKFEKKIQPVAIQTQEQPLEKKEYLQKLATDNVVAKKKSNAEEEKPNKPVVDKKTSYLRTNYSENFGEIKDIKIKYLEKTEQLKESFTKVQLPPQVKKIAMYAGLVLSGALLMWFIQTTTAKNSSAKQTSSLQADTNNTNNTTQAAGLEDENATTLENYQPANIPVVKQPEIKPIEEEIAIVENSNLPVNKTEEKVETPVIKPEKVEKNTKPVNEVKIVKAVTADNILPKLALKANDFKVGSFGGIRNLEMTLQNDSKYFLDKVIIEIKYLNPEGNIVNTDNVSFQSIQPGEATTIPVTKSKRGVKIEYSITKIESEVLTNNNSKNSEPDNFSKN